jgi:hypothetical protein
MAAKPRKPRPNKIPVALSDDSRTRIKKLLEQMGPADVARTMGIARSSVYRLLPHSS